MPKPSPSARRIAVAGASSLLGKELKQLLEDRSFPADIAILDAGDAAGTLTVAHGEATFVQELNADSLAGARFVFFAGSPESAERHWHTALEAGVTVIDLSGGLRPETGALTWIPALDRVLPPPPAKPTKGAAKISAYRSPGTAVIIASTIAAVLARFRPSRVVITLCAPVSEAGQAGVDDLEQQTTHLLAMKPIERKAFDAQVAFNILSSYGPECQRSMERMRMRIATDTAHYLAGRADSPALCLIQVPVFYGYVFSAYAEFSAACDTGEIEAAMFSAGVSCADPGAGAPDNISAAGESTIQLGPIERDPTVKNAIWLYGVADNMRLPASNAVRIAEELLGIPV